MKLSNATALVIASITLAATVITTYIATLPTPTQAQIALATIGATIATNGVTKLLNEQAGRSQSKRSRRKPEVR